MKDSILVTGGFGYLGGRIAVDLATRGYKVLLGSRQIRSAPDWLPTVQPVRVDVTDPESMAEATRKCSAVIHLAAMNEILSGAEPLAAIQVNTVGTYLLLEAALKNEVKQFLYFSTAHVYRSPLVGDISEDLVPMPQHPYAYTHRAAEDYIVASHARGEISGGVIRLSNGFGSPTHPGVDRWTLLVNDLCRQAVERGSLTLKSSGLQHRDFIPLTDVVDAARFLVENPVSSKQDCIFNLGSGQSISVLKITEMIAERCKKSLGFLPEIHRPQPLGNSEEIPVSYSVQRLKDYGFTPGGDLEAEIDRMLEFCSRFFGGKDGTRR